MYLAYLNKLDSPPTHKKNTDSHPLKSIRTTVDTWFLFEKIIDSEQTEYEKNRTLIQKKVSYKIEISLLKVKWNIY